MFLCHLHPDIILFSIQTVKLAIEIGLKYEINVKPNKSFRNDTFFANKKMPFLLIRKFHQPLYCWNYKSGLVEHIQVNKKVKRYEY